MPANRNSYDVETYVGVLISCKCVRHGTARWLNLTYSLGYTDDDVRVTIGAFVTGDQWAQLREKMRDYKGRIRAVRNTANNCWTSIELPDYEFLREQ